MSASSEELQGYHCAGFGVGQGVVMVLQVVAAAGGDSMELVVGELSAESLP